VAKTTDIDIATDRLLNDPKARLLLAALDRMGDRAEREPLFDTVLSAFQRAHVSIREKELSNRMKALKNLNLIEITDSEVILTDPGREVLRHLAP
jgi:hypothetical protein